MKTLTLFLLTFLIASPPAAFSSESWEPAYNELLINYVKPSGVDYASWKKDVADLNKLALVLKSISLEGPTKEDRNTRLAYYINSYNIWILHSVLERFPLASVKDTAPSFGFFSEKRINVAGSTLSLNDLEKQILLKQFGDPRIHFAINCASVSCPPLLNRSYTASLLNAQLDQVTKTFINENPEAVRINGESYSVSSIFDWYAEDFKLAGGAVTFINQFKTKPIPDKATINYLPYNWQLNKSK